MSEQTKDPSRNTAGGPTPSAGGQHASAAGSAGSAGGAGAMPPGVIELEDPGVDLETAMREAVRAVEAVEAEGAAAAGAGQVDATGAARQGDAPPPDVAALRREIADLRDRSMRTLADFDNYRKRAERERQDVRRYALLEPLRDFLPIADNLDRALSAGGSAGDLKTGVEMILRQMHELLRRFGVREVAAAGEVFNPAVHEAVAREESEAAAVPTVAETLVRGYMLHDRLLRPAMVKVVVPPERAAAPAAPPADSAGSEGSGPPESPVE
jgi:molecular chaperone GrpE